MAPSKSVQPCTPTISGTDTGEVADSPSLDTCDVCGALIPEGLAVFTMLDALAGPVVVMRRDCTALDDQIEDAVE